MTLLKKKCIGSILFFPRWPLESKVAPRSMKFRWRELFVSFRTQIFPRFAAIASYLIPYSLSDKLPECSTLFICANFADSNHRNRQEAGWWPWQVSFIQHIYFTQMFHKSLCLTHLCVSSGASSPGKGPCYAFVHMFSLSHCQTSLFQKCK